MGTIEMKQDKHGIQIFDEAGASVLEIGPHVVRAAPQFAERIGAIAASWAQAEVNLYCLFAILLDTTPDEAAKHLKKYGTAARATDGARKLAAQCLGGAELTSVTKILDQLDKVRVRRNRVQHDVWAKKGSDDQTMFAVHSDLYLAFTTKLVAINESATHEREKSERAINLANEFAAEISNGYSINHLEDIECELDLLSKSLLTAMLSCVSRRLKDE